MNSGFSLGDQLIEFLLRFDIQLDDSVDIVWRVTDAADGRDRADAAWITFAGASIDTAAPVFRINSLFAVDVQNGPLARGDDGGLAIGEPVIVQLPQNVFAGDVLARQLGRVTNHSDHDRVPLIGR